MTYRERRESKAERLREWAAKREVKGTTEVEQGRQMLDAIPFGQPMLVDHYSYGRDRNYRGRAVSTLERGFENTSKAESFRSRADNIESALERSIYSDDPDATERLTERVAELEAERDRIKAVNATFRREHRDELKAMSPYQRNQAMPSPSYVLTNLTGNIARNKKRLAQLQRGSNDVA